MATTPSPTYEPSATPPAPRPQHVPMMLSDLYLGGTTLLVISAIFLVVNGFVSWIIFKNWSTIKRSRFFNSFLLGLVLSLADLALASLVGLPASFHLTWMTYFREQPPMRFYSMYIGHFLFEYIFLFRVLVIALLSTDCFLHIQFPLRYDAYYESRRRVQVACGVAAAVPLLFRTLPSLVILWKYSHSLTCMQYDDPNATTYEETANAARFYLPLTCGIFLKEGYSSIGKVDVIILATIIVLSGFVVAATNITSLLTAFMRVRNRTFAGSGGISIRQIVRATMIVCFIIFTFMLTNFPYLFIWLMDYLSKLGYSKFTVNDQKKFYLVILTFLSLIFHPWFFVLRLKSFRDLLKGFKRKLAKSIRSSQHLTKSSLASPMAKEKRLDKEKSVDSIKMKKTSSKVYRNNSPFYQTQTTNTNIAQVTTAAELQPVGMQTDC